MTSESARTVVTEIGGVQWARTRFFHVGEGAALEAALDWCKVRGLSVGKARKLDARGLRYGKHDIAEWRFLSALDRQGLDGSMSGNYIHGPVIILVRVAVGVAP